MSIIHCHNCDTEIDADGYLPDESDWVERHDGFYCPGCAEELKEAQEKVRFLLDMLDDERCRPRHAHNIRARLRQARSELHRITGYEDLSEEARKNEATEIRALKRIDALDRAAIEGEGDGG